MAIALVCGLAASGLSQTTPEQEALLQEIRQEAVSDAQIEGYPLQDAIDGMTGLYLDQAQQAGLSELDIVREYKQAYQEAKQAAAAGNPFGALRPEIGWIAAAIFFVLALFRDVAKKWITASELQERAGDLAGPFRFCKNLAVLRFQAVANS